MELYDDGATFPHPLLGLKTDVSDLNRNSEIVDIKPLIEAHAIEIRHLQEANKKLQEANLEILDKLDSQKILVKELFIRLSAIEDGEVDTVPISSTNIADMIEYQGYDKTIITALMYLGKKGTIYVKDLKRLGIAFRFDTQYIRFLHKLGQISGNPIKQTKSGFWYVEKKKDDDDN